ncbi:MAG: hypothetical protein HY926_09800 [Elusimicrobia bacterium]|nr:hypothetical protein [Elusimicrobiota bacterium]
MRTKTLLGLGLAAVMVPVCYLARHRPQALASEQLRDSLSDDFGGTKGQDLKFRKDKPPESAIPGAPVAKTGARRPRPAQCPIETSQAAGLLAAAGVTGDDGLKDAARVQRWLADPRNFKPTAGGGKTIGKSSVQGLLGSRELTGCHDWGLMKSALLRCAGYEAQMVDTAGVDWMNGVRSGKLGSPHSYQGHVFVEARIAGSWVLLDSVSPRYVADYDPSQPLIPMKVGDQDSYCVMFKGKDPPSYGIDSVQKLNRHMDEFAQKVDPSKLDRPGCRVLELPPVDE